MVSSPVGHNAIFSELLYPVEDEIVWCVLAIFQCTELLLLLANTYNLLCANAQLICQSFMQDYNPYCSLWLFQIRAKNSFCSESAMEIQRRIRLLRKWTSQSCVLCYIYTDKHDTEVQCFALLWELCYATNAEAAKSFAGVSGASPHHLTGEEPKSE